jgi:hypothetical protein
LDFFIDQKVPVTKSCLMGVYEVPPELAAKYIPPNHLARGCDPWKQVLGNELAGLTEDHGKNT